MIWILSFILVVLIIYGSICVCYYFLQERMLFVPLFELDSALGPLRVESKEYTIPTDGEGHIHAIMLIPKASKGLVFYLHGNTGGIQRWQLLSQEICELGFHVFVMDYRGYGLSKGKRSEILMHRDVELCFHFAQSICLPVKTIIYGRSLGCAFAVHLAVRVHADGLLLETPFHSLTRLAKYYLPYLPLFYLMRYTFRSDRFISKVNMPITIFHGTRDDLIPYSHAFELFEAAANANRDVEMITILGAHHGDLNTFSRFQIKRQECLDAITIE